MGGLWLNLKVGLIMLLLLCENENENLGSATCDFFY